MSKFMKDVDGEEVVECDECHDIIKTGQWCRCGTTGLFAPKVNVISEEIG